MIISKQVQRLIDAMRMRFEQLAPQVIDWKAFYSMPAEDDGYIDAARLLQRDDRIAWPWNPCLLFALDPTIRTNDWKRQTVVGIIPHERVQFRGRYCHLVEMIYGSYSADAQISVTGPKALAIAKLSDWSSGIFHDRDAIGEMDASFREFLAHCQTDKASWLQRTLGASMGDDPWCSVNVSYDWKAGRLVDWVFPAVLMFYLASLASPTGYQIEVNNKHPVGTKARKRNPNANRLYTTINWNRMYTLRQRPDESIPLSEYVDRDRRAHWRCMWKESGVPLERLPRSAKERTALADHLGVRRVFVHKHTCKFRHAEDEQYRYEILDGGSDDGA